MAVQPAGAAAEFRRCIAETIFERVDINELLRVPGPHHLAVVQLDHILDRLLGDSPSDTKRKMILKFHFNAGVLKRAGPVDRRMLADVCAEAIFPCPYPVWKRARWMKTSRPIREITLLFTMGVGPLAVKKVAWHIHG